MGLVATKLDMFKTTLACVLASLFVGYITSTIMLVCIIGLESIH